MHLGVDLLFLLPGETGGRETYSRELLRGLRRVRSDLCVTTFVNRETAAAGAGFWSEEADRTLVLPRVSARSRARWAAGELLGVTRVAARAGIEVLHGPANFAPPHGQFARVLTLHDLLHRRLPETISPVVRLATAALVEPAARRAHRVITGSGPSREEILRDLQLPAERVVVVHHGIAAPPSGSAAGDAARALTRFGLPRARPIALAIATDVPHKNLPALIEAVALLDPSERPLLVLAGHGTDRGTLAHRAAELGVADDVRPLGGIPTDALEDLFAAAAVYVTATLHEGFGLPVLEAMARGVPVVCSDLPVLREVAGVAAAGWLDPRDPATIARALREVTARDVAEVERIRAGGRARAATFTWDATAAATAAIYDDALAVARAPVR
ncbi:MAG: glycosyltransferase family 1 protein [Conexibacter sp.]|nr:glycosyltransferase family 1 protein [Conexibacter sp.]